MSSKTGLRTFDENPAILIELEGDEDDQVTPSHHGGVRVCGLEGSSFSISDVEVTTNQIKPPAGQGEDLASDSAFKLGVSGVREKNPRGTAREMESINVRTGGYIRGNTFVGGLEVFQS